MVLPVIIASIVEIQSFLAVHLYICVCAVPIAVLGGYLFMMVCLYSAFSFYFLKNKLAVFSLLYSGLSILGTVELWNCRVRLQHYL